MSQHLEVDGVKQDSADLYRFTLRWTEGTPVLYRNGYRVTKGWKLTLDVNTPPDPHGGNANTE